MTTYTGVNLSLRKTEEHVYLGVHPDPSDVNLSKPEHAIRLNLEESAKLLTFLMDCFGLSIEGVEEEEDGDTAIPITIN